jgi:TPR repeat protein
MNDAIENEEVQKFAESGNIRAKFLSIRNKNPEKALKFATELASDPKNPLRPLGQYMLHMDYRENDPAKALELLRDSAKAGCASAIGNLSLLYMNGTLGNLKAPKDENHALELAQQAVEKDNLYGFYAIGSLYFGPASRNLLHCSQAFATMQKAKDIGYRYGEYYLARFFEINADVGANRQSAIELYRKALHSFHLKNNDHSMDATISAAIRRLEGREFA